MTHPYIERGFVVLPTAIPESRAWRHAVLSHREELAPIRYADPQGERPEGIGGHLCYDVGDASWCDRRLPGIQDGYLRVRSLGEALAGPLDLSPLGRSRYVVKLYPAPEGEQGWHFDTNGVTALLYLSTNMDGTTRIQGLDGLEYTIFPRTGDLLFLQGRVCWHRADPVHEGVKIVIPFNLYLPGEYSRPTGLDTLIYGPET